MLTDVFYPCYLANNNTLFCACWNWSEAIPAPDTTVIFAELSLDVGWTIPGGPAYWSDEPENKHPHTPPENFSGRSVVK